MTAGLRRGLLAATLVVVVVATAWVGRVLAGRRALAASDAAAARGDRVEAVLQARAAAQARCPGCSASTLGYARLVEMATEAEQKGDDATAIACWRAVRAAALAGAVVDTSPPRRVEADAELARLERRRAMTAGGLGPPAPDEDGLRNALSAPAVPSGVVFFLVALGGALFLRGAIGLASAPRPRALEPALSLLGAVIAAAGLLLF